MILSLAVLCVSGAGCSQSQEAEQVMMGGEVGTFTLCHKLFKCFINFKIFFINHCFIEFHIIYLCYLCVHV